jgi:hypothetical protein
MRIGCFGTVLSMSSGVIENQDTMEQHLRALLYMKDFEILNISQSFNQFNSCNKMALAKSLWVTHRKSVDGLRLIIKLCIDYGISDDLLENALNALFLKDDVSF